LTNDDGTPIHPRRRINEKLKDGETVIVKLKDRKQKQDEDS
jgi:hypothetical protein